MPSCRSSEAVEITELKKTPITENTDFNYRTAETAGVTEKKN